MYQGVKILMVDDEQHLLESYRRVLRDLFDFHTALGSDQALAALKSDGPFAVIVSDIKMPAMSGIDLLAQVKKLYPETIRIVLTGYADLQTAIDSVNRGDIFRFLTKPCDIDSLTQAIVAGIEQFELTRAANELAIVQRLKAGLEQTLKAFTRLVEFRDPYTAGHMDRTATISARIAERMGMDKDVTQGLRLAATVHDIGKVAVPAGILNKPGKLSEAEFALIKAHPIVGAEVFKTMDTQWPISRIILEHHERSDGSGYPYGLYSKQTLPESKVLQVADIIDAVMTHRPYRQSLGPGLVIQILNENKGKKLDEPYVDAAIGVLEELTPLWEDKPI